MKLLTIAIPTYNRSEACMKTVKNFISQIRNNRLEDKVHILVSDNCSEDDTYKKLSGLQNSNPDILTINKHSENLGFAKNCLYLMENCTTEYIWTCGDDDTYDENALKIVMHHLEEKDLIYLFMNCLWPNGKKKWKKGVEITEDFYGSFTEAMSIIRDSASYMSLNVVKTNLLKEASWHSDTWIIYEKIVSITPEGNAYVIAEPLVKYSYASESTNWFYQEEKLMLFFCEMLHFILTERDNKVLSKFRFHMLDLYGRQLETYLNSLRKKNGLKNFNQYKYIKYKNVYQILLPIALAEFVIILWLLIS